MAVKDNGFVDLGSVTQAQKAQRFLKESGITAVAGKITSPSGCSWGVYIKDGDRETAVMLLRAASYKIL